MKRMLCVLIGLWLAGPQAWAWSNKEHIQMTRMAAERLIADPATPPRMVQWLKEATPGLLDAEGERDYFMHKRVGLAPRGVDGLAYWATMPDMMAAELGDRAVAPFGVPERMLHFLDVELFMPDPAQRNYADDLSHKPALEQFPRDITDTRYKQAGMLPFRVEQSYQQLVQMIRQGRLDDREGQYPRDEHAARWAGFLSHYAQDSTQPQHGTLDYRSASYFPGAAKAPNIHGDMEYRLMDDDYDDYMDLRAEFWPVFVSELQEAKDPVQDDDPWQGTLKAVLASYDALPLIGRAGAAAYSPGPEGKGWTFNADAFFHYKGECRGQKMTLMQLKARQMAWAVLRTEHLWRRAWAEAAKAGQ